MYLRDYIGPLALLLFTVALLLFTCLCILCKRKHRKTRDISHQTQVNSSEGGTRGRASLANLCGDVESSISVESGEDPAPPIPERGLSGRTNLVFESDDANLPPGYDEALKSKYAKVYSIYPGLGSLRRASAPASLLPSDHYLSPSTSSSSSSGASPSTSLETVLSRPDLMESPPPPYDLAVRYIDSRGHF
ncbi:hypothetical protein BV898_05298 [Hypsibius exemplaris]|uniref:Uncharacterized protein n=1 Tax=Hypsibius exemplaris TaxID=2072580 RepID=A0A1W0WZV8_HYPEX|nr:hypothetical protein BV898_05298 [Hypsibius exemplaris]